MRRPISVAPTRRSFRVTFGRQDRLWSADVQSADREAAIYEAPLLLAVARYHELNEAIGRITGEADWRVVEVK